MGIEYYQGEPFTGIAWTPGYPGNYISIESEYEDGNLIEVRIFYPNGQLSEQVHYKNGNFHGNYKKFNENGEHTKQAQYKNGEKDGSTKFYDSKGQLKYEQEWKDGERVSEKTY